jgi:hypothetical protein
MSDSLIVYAALLVNRTLSLLLCGTAHAYKEAILPDLHKYHHTRLFR